MELEQSILKKKQVSLQSKIVGDIDKIIKKLTVDKKNEDKRYDDINRSVRQHNLKLNAVDTLKSSVEFLVQDMNNNVANAKFIS